jgi:hypothetical protein
MLQKFGAVLRCEGQGFGLERCLGRLVQLGWRRSAGRDRDSHLLKKFFLTGRRTMHSILTGRGDEL